jgi:biopolymer transport protein ExbB
MSRSLSLLRGLPALLVLATAAAWADGPAATAEAVNPYGLEALWHSGDFIARGTLMILVLMSMGSWYFLITKLFDQTRLLKQGAEARSQFWTASSVAEGAGRLSQNSAYRFIAETGIQAMEHHEGKLMEQIDRHTWVTLSLDRAVSQVQSGMQNGLTFLATVGSTAPFVGLFGTVWGIYHALTAIGIAGQASIDKVAGPVGEALIMTAIGLAVAVPAVLGYNILVRRNRIALDQIRAFGADLHGVLLGGQPRAVRS